MDIEAILKKISYGLILSFIILGILFSSGGFDSIGKMFLNTNLPGFNDNAEENALMKYEEDKENKEDKKDKKEEAVFNDKDLVEGNNEITELIGIGDVVFQDESDTEQAEAPKPPPSVPVNLELLANLEELKKNYYIVDKKTGMSSDYFNVNKFMSENLKINKENDKPKILVFHTHSKEMFKDSNTADLNEGIVGAGTRLCQRLEEKGLKTIHITDSFDVVNGKTQIIGAYERMEPKIRQVLSNNPSVELVIDLHRDGVNENTHLVQTINGKATAQIMFFNGLCRLNQNGKLNELNSLKNPYIPTNLALSFNMKKTADEMYPGLARRIYLNAYRYSLHMMPKSTLIEVGAQTNTKQEIYNAVDLLSEILYNVIC